MYLPSSSKSKEEGLIPGEQAAGTGDLRAGKEMPEETLGPCTPVVSEDLAPELPQEVSNTCKRTKPSSQAQCGPLASVPIGLEAQGTLLVAGRAQDGAQPSPALAFTGESRGVRVCELGSRWMLGLWPEGAETGQGQAQVS